MIPQSPPNGVTAFGVSARTIFAPPNHGANPARAALGASCDGLILIQPLCPKSLPHIDLGFNLTRLHLMDLLHLIRPPHRERGRIQLPTADVRDFTRDIGQRLAGFQRRFRPFLLFEQRLQLAPRRHRLGVPLLRTHPQRRFAASAAVE